MAIHDNLRSVVGLKKGRTDAKETDPIRPVDPAVFVPTIGELPQMVADLAHAQRLAGMRTSVLLCGPRGRCVPVSTARLKVQTSGGNVCGSHDSTTLRQHAGFRQIRIFAVTSA